MGVEAEGRLKGVPTCFVEGWDISEAGPLLVNPPCGHIMFGAKGYVMQPADFRELASILGVADHREVMVTIHHPISDIGNIPTDLTGVHWLLYQRVQCAHLLGGDVEVKLENSQVAFLYANPVRVDLAYLYDRPHPPASPPAPPEARP